LPQAIVNQIESYKETDEDLWNVFGLGLPAKNNELIYNHYQFYDDDDLYVVDEEGTPHKRYDDIIYGLDFGFNHPTALVKVYINVDKRTIWCEEVIHQSYLTTPIQNPQHLFLKIHYYTC
jgi:phage terminase large subunit